MLVTIHLESYRIECIVNYFFWQDYHLSSKTTYFEINVQNKTSKYLTEYALRLECYVF